MMLHIFVVFGNSSHQIIVSWDPYRKRVVPSSGHPKLCILKLPVTQRLNIDAPLSQRALCTVCAMYPDRGIAVLPCMKAWKWPSMPWLRPEFVTNACKYVLISARLLLLFSARQTTTANQCWRKASALSWLRRPRDTACYTACGGRQGTLVEQHRLKTPIALLLLLWFVGDNQYLQRKDLVRWPPWFCSQSGWCRTAFRTTSLSDFVQYNRKQ